MTDEYGLPVLGNPVDYQDFLLRLYDLIDDANEMHVSPNALHLSPASETYSDSGI